MGGDATQPGKNINKKKEHQWKKKKKKKGFNKRETLIDYTQLEKFRKKELKRGGNKGGCLQGGRQITQFRQKRSGLASLPKDFKREKTSEHSNFNSDKKRGEESAEKKKGRARKKRPFKT